MTVRSGPVVAVVGADGAGKSTVTALLAERLTAAGHAAARVDRWDIADAVRYPTASCLTGDVAVARRCAALMPGVPRLLFLLWASALALTGRPAGTGEILLLDGHWQKHAASEIAYGADVSWVEAVGAGLPAADLTVHLRIDPEDAWARKDGRAVPFECGMDLSCSRESFLAHQRSIAATLDRWAARDGWLVLDARTPPERLVARLVPRVLALTGAEARDSA
ncbi:dTMP kinase [Amycolatopsis solani]|uniref:dTMP kinase n=1 Tax=Amycolatopsis solani TaxID=3028615 RepID=UPI00296EA861|nr:thymidylate kinase [Amycolatopsis sp. MEP2-6]